MLQCLIIIKKFSIRPFNGSPWWPQCTCFRIYSSKNIFYIYRIIGNDTSITKIPTLLSFFKSSRNYAKGSCSSRIVIIIKDGFIHPYSDSYIRFRSSTFIINRNDYGSGNIYTSISVKSKRSTTSIISCIPKNHITGSIIH